MRHVLTVVKAAPASVQAQLDALQTEQQHAAAGTGAPAPQAERTIGRDDAGANGGAAHPEGMLQASASALAALQQQQAEVSAEKADLQALCGRLADSEAALTAQCSQLRDTQALLATEARDAKEQLAAAQKEAERAKAALRAEGERMQRQLTVHAAKDGLEQQLSDMQRSSQAAAAGLKEQLARAEASAGAHDAALQQRTAELEALAGERDTLAQQCVQLQALQASYRARITELEAVRIACLLGVPLMPSHSEVVSRVARRRWRRARRAALRWRRRWARCRRAARRWTRSRGSWRTPASGPPTWSRSSPRTRRRCPPWRRAWRTPR